MGELVQGLLARFATYLQFPLQHSLKAILGLSVYSRNFFLLIHFNTFLSNSAIDHLQINLISLDEYLQMLLTPNDLSFVGYTYKNFDAVKGLHHSFGIQFFLHTAASDFSIENDP